MVNIKNNIIHFVVLALLLAPLAVHSKATGNYSSREDVSSFVDKMSIKHGFDRNKLMDLLSTSEFHK